MALELGSLREALVEAGASPEKARQAAAELASYENRFDGVDHELADFRTTMSELKGELNLLKWMIGFNLAMTLAILWRVFLR